MSFSVRACAHPQRPSARVAVSGLFLGILFYPLAASAKSDEDDQQRMWLPSAPSEARGEITYEFDSVLNETTATYVAPLGKRDLMHRLFSTPTVHTVIASYHINGRIASHLPDTIRVVLESDEYVEQSSESRLSLFTPTMLNIGVGERMLEHSLSVAQRTELETPRRGMPENAAYGPDRQRFEQSASAPLAHVRRKATAWFSMCDFLSLIHQREIHGTVAGLDFRLNAEVVAGLNRFAAEMLAGDAPRFIDCVDK